jgi:hypothetical protein
MYEMLFSSLHDYLFQRWENLPTLLSLVIGLDEMVDKVLRNLQNNNFYILVVVGIGRIRKTNLVKILYYQIQGEFQKLISGENVKSMVVKHVEKQLLKYLCGMELEAIKKFHQHLKECWMEKKGTCGHG